MQLVTHHVSDDTAEALIHDLEGVLQIEEHSPLFFKADVFDCATIQLIGDVVKWSPLWLPSISFLKKFGDRIAERAADAAWDRGAEALQRIVRALAKAGRSTRRPVRFRFALPVADRMWGTGLWCEPTDEFVLARTLAVFVTRAEEIIGTIRREAVLGNQPWDHVHVELMPDGSCELSWEVLEEQAFRKEKRVLGAAPQRRGDAEEAVIAR
jgi:hypothetical protein